VRPEEQFPVDEGHNVGCEVVHESTRYALINGKCFQHGTIVAELSQHHFVMIHYQWTRRVAVVLHGHTWTDRHMDTETDI